MLRQGRIVLLFDGFDELVTRVTYDRAADHLDTLLQAAEDKAKIVVTSRTQHFKSHAQVLTALGERVGLLPQRRVLSVEDFTPAQIRSYLVNRYGGDERGRRRPDRLLARHPGPAGALPQPADARLHRRPAPSSGCARSPRRAGTPQRRRPLPGDPRLLARLRGAPGQGVPGAPAGLSRDELWQAVTRIWPCGCGRASEPYLRLAELAEVAETLDRASPTAGCPAEQPRTRSARAACWSAPTRACSGSSTAR